MPTKRRPGIHEVATRLADGLLDRPIGTPARFLPEDAADRIETSVGPVLWEWLQGQVPDLIRRLDVARRVEQKVVEFPTPKMEELVRKVTDRELRLIVQLGYALGAFIGVLLLAALSLSPSGKFHVKVNIFVKFFLHTRIKQQINK